MESPICGMEARVETDNLFNQDRKIDCSGYGIFKASDDAFEFSKGGGAVTQINRG